MRLRIIATPALLILFVCGICSSETHPKALFGPSDITAIRNKLNSSHFSSSFNSLVNRYAEKLTDDYSSSELTEHTKGTDALNFAYLALFLDVSDPLKAQFAQKTEEILLNINEGLWTRSSLSPVKWDWDDFINGTALGSTIHGWYPGQVIMNYSLAYDWLIGSGHTVSEANKEKIRARLFLLIRNECANQHRRGANMRLRSIAGTGMAALLFSDQAGIINDPENLLSGTTTPVLNMGELLDYVISDLFVKDNRMPSADNSGSGCISNFVARDGAYKEGASYQKDSFSVVNPFLHAYYFNTGINYFKGDNGYDDRILKMYEWNLKTLMPNGKSPTVDTGWYASPQSPGTIIRFSDNPDWLQWLYQYVFKSKDGSIYTPIFYDPPDQLSPPEPPFKTVFMEESGYGVFRSSWDKNSTYMLLLAENLPNASSHEQADQTSFILYAKKAYLAIDPGDGRAYRNEPNDLYNYKSYQFSRSEQWMQSGFGHNLITVDSEFDPEESLRWSVEGCHPKIEFKYSSVTDPAYIKNTIIKDYVDYAEAHMDYSDVNVNLVRSAAFLRKQYFIIEDRLRGSRDHDYAWQIHFGGGTSVGSLTKEGSRYTWTMPNEDSVDVSLDVSFLNGPEVFEVFEDGPTNYTGARYPEDVFAHTYLRAKSRSKERIYTTILYPRYSNESNLRITEMIPGEAWNIELNMMNYDILISKKERNTIRVGPVSTDALYLAASFSRSNQKDVLLSAVVKGASFVSIDNYKEQFFDPLSHYANYIDPQQLDYTNPHTPLTVFVTNNLINPSKSQKVNIRYEITKPGDLNISVYSSKGQLVKKIVDEPVGAVIRETFWDGTDSSGKMAGSGLYFIHCTIGSSKITKKVVVVK